MTNETKATQHTLGPWIAQESVDGHWYIWHHIEGSGISICDVSGFPSISAPSGDDVVEANARLIADAPRLKESNEELLAALEALLTACSVNGIPERGAREPAYIDLMDAVKAISRARGQS